MSRQDADIYKEVYSNGLLKSSSSLLSQPLLAKDNPIQLAAISNYKLAQLTFSAPDWNSLRKTALIKNMTQVIYTDTPNEWLDQMCRWQFFTPESLANMTQDGLEHIFAQYIQTIEAFKPINLNEDDDDDDDDDDDEIWQQDEILTPDDIQLEFNKNISTNSTTMPVITEYPLYSHSSASISVDILYQKEFKPLPDRPPSTKQKNDRRKSIASMRNRLSWTSDTGLLPSSLVGHNWANELMTMFNMEFQVDTSLTLSTAPKLPELPFSSRHNQHKRRSRKSQRYSTDSFMNLIPAFETFKLEEPERRLTSANRPRNMTFPPPPPSPPPPPPSTITSRPRSSSHPISIDSRHRSQVKPGPTRSSSLKYNNHQSKQSSMPKHRSMDIFNGWSNVFSGATGNKSLTKKKSIRRLAALFTGTNTNNNGINKDNKHRPSLSSVSLSSTSSAKSSTKQQSPSSIYQTPSPPTSYTRLPTASVTSHLSTTSSSPASSTTSVCVTPTKTSFMHIKPLPEIPPSATIYNHSDINRRKSFTLTVPTIVKKSNLQRSKSVGYRPNKNKDTLKASSGINQENEDSTNISISLSNRSTHIRNPKSTTAPKDELDNTSTISPKGQCITDSARTTLQSNITTFNPPSPQPKRSKSTIMKLGSGLARRHTKGQKKVSATKDSNTENNFVTRMASLGKRMKLQRA